MAVNCLLYKQTIPQNCTRRLFVRRLERDLQDVLDELAGLELGREMHAFPYRRLGARIVT